jgi:hypothetical protein
MADGGFPDVPSPENPRAEGPPFDQLENNIDPMLAFARHPKCF